MKTTQLLFAFLWIQIFVCKIVESNNLDVTDIRLVDGSGPFEGRVEIQVDGIWGTVCDEDFNMNDARVMCKMIDLLPTGFVSGAHFGQGTGPIFAQEFDCNGYENDIGQCTFQFNVFCSHSRDVGIICSECGEITIRHGGVNSISSDGTVLTISCDKGYKTDTSTSTCINETWSIPTLTCSLIGLNISDVRLGNAVGIADGRVELLVNGTWGTVCRNGIGIQEANVLCRMFGFDEVYKYHRHYSYGYGQGTGPIYLTNLDCIGTETHINNCTYDTVTSTSCFHYYDVAVICKYPLNVTDIRLVDGSGPYDGRVEVFRNGIWGTVCSRNYDLEEMELFCKMLNLNFTSNFSTPVYGQGIEPILIGELYCNGEETNVNNCIYNPPYRWTNRINECNHGYDLTLVCTPCGQINIPYGYVGRVNGSEIIFKCNKDYQPDEFKMTCLPNGTWLHEEICTSKYAYPLDIDDIRLVSNYAPTIPTEGRVEILVDGLWGTICDNNFNIKSANVTCHMFGLHIQSYYTNAANFGSGTGPIFIDNLNCTGSETHINNCSYEVANTCTHNDDVSVICTGYQLNITGIRLAGTNGPYHGRIELEVNGTWGTVCHGQLTSNDASVFCRMLGLTRRTYYHNAYYGEGSGPIYIDQLLCYGSESHINDCKHAVNNYYNCDHGGDASVMCYGPTLNITEARLVDGTSVYDGRAEIKVNDTWGTICDANFNILAADLFCDLLGLRAARFFTGAIYGDGSGPVFIDQVFCNSNDLKLSSCQYLFLNECSHARDISVVCNECGQPDIYHWDAGFMTNNGSTLYADCSFYNTYVGTLKLTCDNSTKQWITEGECQEYSYPLNITNIRLVGGPSQRAGRVEVESFDTWGSVCSHSFGQNEANVICSMIGYPPAVSYTTVTDYGTGKGPIFVDDLVCGENASHLDDCSYNTYDNCNHDDDISVVCTDCGNPTPKDGLINSSMTNVGAVVFVSCDKVHKRIGDAVITCQLNGLWSDTPTCEIIDCGDPIPLHGFGNTSTTIKGTLIAIGCDKGYDLVGDSDIICQENETWTDIPVCRAKDCGQLSIPNADVALPNNKTTYGETILISCSTGYILNGNPTVSCRSDGTWETLPVCDIVDCGDPTPVRGQANSNKTTYGSVLKITCDVGYNVSGNATIICLEDGRWSSNPVCDATDCGLLSVPNSYVNDSKGSSVGSVAIIKCNKGYDIKGSSLAVCIGSGESASWNYSATCERQLCVDPTPQNGFIANTDSNEEFVYGNFVEIECDRGYTRNGDEIITCNDGGVWSDNTSCSVKDCGPIQRPLNGTMDDYEGTTYNAEVIFSCIEGFLLLGKEKTICIETGEWSNVAPTCVAKSNEGGSCVSAEYCLLQGSRCVNSVCKCITGIYDTQTKKCDTMPLMPYGTKEGDVSLQNVCGKRVTFEPGFPIFNKMYYDLYVCAFGYIAVEYQFKYPTPPKNNKSLQNFFQDRVILAPFFGPIDRHNSGEVFYRSYDITAYEAMKKNVELITYIENIVRKFGNLDSFDASFLLIATWLEVKPLSKNFDGLKTSTFQSVFVSDGRTSYSFYIYGNGKMQWVNNLSPNPNVWVGYNADSITNSHPYSFSDAALQLDSKLTVSTTTDQDVAGIVFNSLNSPGQQSNAAIDCIRWYNENYEDKKRLDFIASLAPECPCDIRLARFDPLFWRIGLYRWQRHLNFMCVDMLHVGNFGHYGKSCCYDLNTWLWVYERPLAGSFQLYNKRYPLEHKLNDEQPKENCCKKSDYCNLYYELRPTGSCYKTSPYNFGTFWGDPHFRTLDGLNFTFNGLGEYTLLKVNTENCSFELQARTGRALKEDGSLSDATVFTAFAATNSVNKSVHVELNKERKGINLYGHKVDLTNQYNSNTDPLDPFFWSSEDNSLTITKRNDSVNVYFPSCDISLIISVSVEMLTLSTFVPENLKNQTKGLLGNYNGVAGDDFTMPNRTVLNSNLTEREIFEYGKTWAINPDNSAFVYDVGKTHYDFHNESYTPRFLDEANPELRAKAENVCNGSQNIECVFDFVFTEKPDIAEATQNFKGQSDEDKREIDEIVPSLEGCATVNATKGQKASCKLNVQAADKVNFVANNVGAEIDEESSTITFTPEIDGPVSIQVDVSNQNGRHSPAFTVSILMCTGCNGHGVCTSVPRNDPDNNEYFRYSTCDCDPEYEGTDCEKVFDGCAASPCSLGRNCTSLSVEKQKEQNRTYTCESCPSGFKEDDEEECKDIDECTINKGGCQQQCTNTDGSFVCACFDGYRVDSRNKSNCKDVNECDEALHNCDHLCANTEGGFTCNCHPGYELSTDSWSCNKTLDVGCSDEQKNTCSDTYGCSVEGDQSICFCQDGYELDDTGTQCLDIDECSRDLCPQDCVNTNGSFQCNCFSGYRLEGVKTCTVCDVLHWGNNCEMDCICTGRGADRCDPVKGCLCKAGWYGTTCNEDINECDSDVQLCDDPRKECVNSLGSYTCNCRFGFEENDQGECEDSNECSDPQLNNCSQVCTNTVGSYSCSCMNGYTQVDRWSCVDIDECQLGISNCGQQCENNEGQYSCFCHFGYSLNDDRLTCSKISDPCLSIGNLTCSHFCLVGDDNAICSCESGYILESDNETCTDIDECSDSDKNKCDADSTCINTAGSFLCECLDGKKLQNDGRTCSECDEYHYGKNCQQKCSCLNGVCDKKTGCVCDPGWAGNYCDIDIDECSTEQVKCTSDHSICVNLLGSARCSCQNGYSNISGVCKDINECDDETLNTCDQLCTNTEGSYSCLCQQGFVFDGICQDINECAGSHGCDQICENTVGSYSCSCEEGFRLYLSNRKTCLPEFECTEEQIALCPHNSTCSKYNDQVRCQCLKGYEDDKGVCEDINECLTASNLCLHNCSNTDGSFTCSCDIGYFLLDDSVTCKECEGWKYGVNCESNCSCDQSNTETCDIETGACTCKTGWEGLNCAQDLDECTNTTVCPNNSDCANTEGSYNCKCRDGYFKTGSSKCEECDFRHFGENCQGLCECDLTKTEDCNHTTGYCICQQGWSGNKCTEDVNECIVSTNSCDMKPDSTCNNTIGSFSCDCNPGFIDKDGVCEECAEWTFGFNCRSNCMCNKTNTETCDTKTGLCMCTDGWNGTNCDGDIDECEDETTCPLNSICYNKDGGFDCTCNPGYHMTNAGKCEICVDGKYGSNCSQTCNCIQENTAMCNHISGNCTCKEGWTGTLCSEDINECNENSTLCENKANSTCENTNGSYSCTCNNGLREQGGICTDCDEWKYGQNCLSNCTCIISKSEYCDPITGDCMCKREWEGVECASDYNECKEADVCPEHSSCNNSEGGYDCLCNTGYIKTESANCTECDEHHFGDSCTEECTCDFENTETCNHISGNCSCIPGWTGETCSVDVDECGYESNVCDLKGNSSCNNINGSFDCVCNDGFWDIKNNTCLECTNNTYGNKCSEHCNCHVEKSANENQTCETATGRCICKSNWTGDMCEEDVNECAEDVTLCSEDANAVCVNTEGWYECDCTKGFTKKVGNNCEADITSTTMRPDSTIQIKAAVVLELDLPTETNLNAASVYSSFALKVIATLDAFYKRFTNAPFEITIIDLRLGSLIANYLVTYNAADKDVASKLVEATVVLGNGVELTYDGQIVNASSDSYQGMAPCDVLLATIESCGYGYVCTANDGIPACRLQMEQSSVNWLMVIGLSAAGLCIVIVSALFVVLMRRKTNKRKQRQHSANRNVTLPNHTREVDEGSDFYRNYKWQDVKFVDAGTRFTASRFMLPRYTIPTASENEYNQSNSIAHGREAMSSKEQRGNYF